MTHQGDMFSKMKYNKSLRDVNRSLFNKYLNPLLTYKKSLLKIDHIDLTVKEHEEIKREIQKQERIRKRNAFIITSLSLILLMILIIGIIIKIENTYFHFRF